MSAASPALSPAISLYNPNSLSKRDLVTGFVARHAQLERLLADLRRETAAGPPQHHLIVGQRGMGKTTLLRRFGFAIEDDPALAAEWLPLGFPEEQYNVSNLGDFWLNCADALSDALDLAGDRAAAASLDARIEAVPRDPARRSTEALRLLTSESARLGRRLILLVDNLDLVLDRLPAEQEWEMRRALQQEKSLLFVGASSRAVEAVYEYGRAFYDFFQVMELKGFDEEETFAVLHDLAEKTGQSTVSHVVKDRPARIRTLRLLTGGNPRTLALLFKILSQSPGNDVERDVEELLDLYTPLYKARIEDLPAQSRQVVDAMALHWDPLTAADLVDRTGLPVNQVSAQLNRLVEFNVVEKTPWFGETKEEKKTAFLIAERFFNIWYLMRSSRRMRRKLVWLVKFLEAWFGEEEVRSRAEGLLAEGSKGDNERYAEKAFAYSEVVSEGRLKTRLQHEALHTVIEDERIRKMIDFSDLPPELQDKRERMEKLRELREKTLRSREDWGEIDPVEFWRLLGGSPHLALNEKARIVGELHLLEACQVRELLVRLQTDEQRMLDAYRREAPCVRKLYELLSRGDLVDAYDWKVVQALAGQDTKALPFVAVSFRVNPLTNTQPLGVDELNRAESALKDMSEDHGLAARAQNALGNLFAWQKRQYSAAEDAYLRAIELNPRDPWPWHNLGWLYHDSLERYAEAENAYRHAIKLDPQFSWPWNNLGFLLHQRLRRHDEAEYAYRRAIEVNQHFTRPWVNLGRLLRTEFPRYAEAGDAFLQAVRLNSSGESLMAEIRECVGLLESSGDLTNAERIACEARSLRPDDLDLAFSLTRILTRAGKWTEARSLLRDLAANESADASDEAIKLLAAIVCHNHIADARAILEETAADQRWRPLYEALRAAEVGNPNYLRRVAPEVRTVAEKILERIAPHLNRNA